MQHFWEKANIPSIWEYIKGIFNSKRDIKRIERKPQYSTYSPTGHEYIKATLENSSKVATFLQENYHTGSSATPETSPKCTITSEWITLQINQGTIYLLVYDNNKEIVGCISASQLGYIKPGQNNIKIRLIREFCISSNWRKKGLGSYLLLKIWDVLKEINEDSVLFLKEGASIPSAGIPLYNSSWIYKIINIDQQLSSKCIILDTSQTKEILESFSKNYDLSIYNSFPPELHTDTIILHFKGFRGEILCAMTDAKQQINGIDIWYMTGWYVKGELLDSESCQAAEEFGKKIAAATAKKAVAVWLDEKVLPKKAAANSNIQKMLPIPSNIYLKEDSNWKKDGPFNWYSFQFTTGIYNDANLFLII
jgi:hypothetical protein